MVKRKVIFYLVAVFFLSVVGVFAQPEQPQQGMGRKKMSLEERAKKDEEMIAIRLEELIQRFNLTPQQQQQVKDIMEKTAATIRQVMEEAINKAEDLRKEDREAINSLLTDDQKAMLSEGPQESDQGVHKPRSPKDTDQE